MTKSKKVFKTSLVAALATAALVPAAVAAEENPANFEIKEVVVDFDGQLVKFDLIEYITNLGADLIDGTQELKYIIDAQGNIFKVEDYILYYGAYLGEAGALEALAEEDFAQTDVEPVVGKIEGGQVVPEGQTPEENSIETFFYNLAA